jgi:anti-anti-sigma regulatory factor
MPTRITQVGDQAGAKRRLKVEGTLTLADAELLEGICDELCEQAGSCISIDLADITFLDSESASVLCRLKGRGILLDGLDLFVRKVVELAEENGSA